MTATLAMHRSIILGAITLLSQRAQAQTSFITVGDWGGAALQEQQYGYNVYNVSASMAAASQTLDASFIIGTGDNFYWCGLENTSDFQIEADWVKPFGSTSPSLLKLPWYNVLGNHEYGYEVQVQLDMAKMYGAWNLDARYYTKRVSIGDSNYISFIFLDTSPCVSEYRSSDPSGWDPCGTEYPTCSQQNPANPNDPFEGPCHFNANILTQDCGAQFQWFKDALGKVPAEDWLIVVGHHPSDEIDVQDFTTAMQQNGFDLYLNGHAHTMTHYSLDGNEAFVTSGNGAMVLTNDQLPTTPGRERTYNKTVGLPLKPFQGHQYEQIFNMKQTGYTTHTFSKDYKNLTTNFISIDSTGSHIVHTFSVQKRGTGPNPVPPSPAPPSPPVPPSPPAPPGPSGGSCCHYKDTSCTSGQTCCKSGCDSPSTCSYTQYGCSGEYGKLHNCEWSGTSCVVH